MMRVNASDDWVTVYQPDENMGAAWETMFTEDSGRIQSGLDVSTPMFTVEQYSYHASYIPVSEATTIIQMIAAGNPVYIHYFSLYYGEWRTAQFRVGKSDSISIGKLIEDEEYYEEFSFNMTGVAPIVSGGGSVNPSIEALTVTSNGTYTASGLVEGYSPVVVNVPNASQSKQATPAFTAQTIRPDTGYDFLSSVSIAAISITRTLNSAGGYTVTIGSGLND